MEQNDSQNMPIYLQMALAHNVSAMRSFLKLDDEAQDEIIQRARVLSKMEIQNMVDNIPKMHL